MISSIVSAKRENRFPQSYNVINLSEHDNKFKQRRTHRCGFEVYHRSAAFHNRKRNQLMQLLTINSTF